jgi:uncharacterized membrane protein
MAITASLPMGENHFGMWPVALYGMVLIMAGVAYTLLTFSLINLQGKNSSLALAVGKDWKGKASVLIYGVGILLSFINPWLGFALYVIVAVL